MRLVPRANLCSAGEKALRMLRDLLARAWSIRLSSFGSKIEWSYPSRTLPVSLTGRSCLLNCAHCGGHYLDSMVSLAEAAEKVRAGRADSLLISGGCGPSGKVPFMEHYDELLAMSKATRLNFHVGLVDREEAVAVGNLGATVSFDFVGDRETVKEVYGLDAGIEDYERSYSLLRQYARVVPHICIGLRGGRLSGEREALRALGRLGADAIVFIVLIPTRGTRYAQATPPDPVEVATIIAEARIAFPGTPIGLGCMRPGGCYRRAIDVLALRSGVNKIVHPSRSALGLARVLGLNATSGKECCVL